MNFRKLAFNLALSSALLLGSAILPAADVYAQCETQGASVGTQSNSQSGMPGPGKPTATTDGAPDFILKVETSMAARTFEHECFSLKSIVKSAVSVCPAHSENESSTYECLWYHDGQPIGLERKSALQIPGDKSVEIKVLQSQSSTCDEAKAVGNTILRLVLDILMNHDKVGLVSVPSASYTNILMELQRRRMSVMPPGEKAPETAKIKFKLESGSTGMTQEVYYL